MASNHDCRFRRSDGRATSRAIRSLAIGALAAMITWFADPVTEWSHGQMPYELPPINYLKAKVNDPAARLQKKLDAGQSQLEFDKKHGYLRSVLKALDVRLSSQILVFSKTSFQQSRISPQRPRALYFNDNVYVGWVQRGDVVEVSAVDPRQGAVFYTLKQQATSQPKFIRQDHSCLVCHSSSHTGGVPGHIVRSVYPDRGGFPLLSAGTFRTDYTSPLSERWGGWYVTGTHGAQRHMGNVMVANKNEPEKLGVESGANVTDLSDRLDVRPYLTGSSDIVAFMVLEHQVVMHNRITAANFSARFTERDAKIMNEALERPADFESDSTRRRFDSAAEKVLEVLLFVDEVQLTDLIRGTSSFAQQFQNRGPFDHQGRSLRQLDLKTRLFRYPCSYLIYSEAFDALPKPVHDRVLRRLWEVLSKRDSSEKYDHLSAEDRRAVFEILKETKTNLPECWKELH